MRYYYISVGGQTYTSWLSVGQNDPNALRVQFSIENDTMVLKGNGSFVRIYGVPLTTLQQASNFNNQPISVYAGFSRGLPLATQQAEHSGLLISGLVWAASGNWRGNDVTLDLLFFPSAGPSASSASSSTASSASSSSASGGSGSDAGGTASTSRLMRRAPATSRLMNRPLPAALSPNRRRAVVRPRDDGDGGGGGVLGSLGSVLGSDFSGALASIVSAVGGGFLNTPINLIHNLQPGQSLASAIQQTLTTAFPGCNVQTLLSQGLKLAYQDSGFYQNLGQLAGYYKQLGQTLSSLTGAKSNPGGPTGIDLYLHDNQYIVTDWTQPSGNVVNLAYTDLIGQPTWVGTNECFFSTVLRADLIPTKIVSFPATIFGVDLEAAGYDNAQVVSSLYPSMLTFSGTVWLHKVRHVGDSRSADGAAWRTDCWAFISGSQEAVQASADISGAVSGAAAAVTSGTNAPNVNLQGVDRQRQRFASRRMRQW